MNSKIHSNNYFFFIVLYILSIYVNYFTNDIIRLVYFLVLLFYCYKSKDDAFWIAFFYMIAYAPGYLFNPDDVKYNLNIFTPIGATSEFSVVEAFVPLLFVKAISGKYKIKLYPIYLFLLAFIAFLYVATFFMDVTMQKMLRTLRFFVPYTLLFALPALLNKSEKFLVLFNYFLSFSILIIGLQIYRIFSGEHLMLTLGGVFVKTIEAHNLRANIDIRETLLYTLYSTHILLLNIIISVYYFLSKKSDSQGGKKPKLLVLFIFLSIFSLILSGNRGYTMAALLIIFLFVLADIKNIKKTLKFAFVSVVLLSSLLMIPAVKSQLTLAIDRISTIFLLVEGDKTAGGTLKRLNIREPRVMKKFWESPIIGQGFSDTFYEYRDGHVANPQILMNSGVIGFSVFLIFIFYFIISLFQCFLKTKKASYLAVVFGILAFMLVHSSSYMVFCYIIGTANHMAFFLLISFAIVLIYECKKNKLLENKHPNPIFQSGKVY